MPLRISGLPTSRRISRTSTSPSPGRCRHPNRSRPIRECEALFLDSIARAKQTIYIESQYFTNDKLASALAARLREPDGPEVIVVSPKECHGWLEKTTMGAFRDGAFRQLLAADDAQASAARLSGGVALAQDVPTFVHSKVMIVDDALVRIGSANFSHRSMGVDTECDLAVEAGGDPDVRAGIRRIRDRLLAEHLGLPVDAVARGIERAGSIARFIDARAGRRAHARSDRTVARRAPPSRGAAGGRRSRRADRRWAPRSTHWFRPSTRRTGAVLFASGFCRLVVLAAAAAVASAVVGDTLDSIPVAPSSLWIGVGVFVLAGSC